MIKDYRLLNRKLNERVFKLSQQQKILVWNRWEQWELTESGHILEAKPLEFSDELEMREEEKRRIKDDSQKFA